MPIFPLETALLTCLLVTQLYTRSYELFKKWGPQNTQNPGRLTLWIAYRIAQTYYESGKFDMAVRSVCAPATRSVLGVLTLPCLI